MARAGLYKSDVQKARDALLAKGLKPSIDAVRIELGNTGSKTTIHKYLRELDDEYGAADDRRASLSDALTDLVERLAARLQEEADERYATRLTQIEAEAQAQNAALQAAQEDRNRLAAQVRFLEVDNHQYESALVGAQESLARESTARQLAEQRAAGLSERLDENEAHRRSLEEKHQHARDALEHYRQAAKEQRETEARRHEQQVQQLQAELRQANQTLATKHDETTRLNREGAHLIAELTQVRQARRSAEDTALRQAQEIDKLRVLQAGYEQMSAKIGERDSQIEALERRLAAASIEQDKLLSQFREIELALTQAQTKADTQEKANVQLQMLLTGGERRAE